MSCPYPNHLYTAAQIRELERCAIQDHATPGLTLMERAGSAAFDLLRECWPDARRIAVICGLGNNAGDAFVLARHAMAAGRSVTLLQLGDPARLSGDARANADHWHALGGQSRPFDQIPADIDVIVDGVLGTGLDRELTGDWAAALAAINHHPAAVLALDIPSGLNADSGRVMGIAVEAQQTATFIAHKPGMFTAEGPQYCGHIHCYDLAISPAIYPQLHPTAGYDRWHQSGWDGALRPPERQRTAHKGTFGHVLLIGGDFGFGGAIRLAGEAALRSGAGLVSIATRPQHAAILNCNRPELMCHAIETSDDLDPLLQRAKVLVIGPGLGQSPWASALWQKVLHSPLPKILDADALNLLAQAPQQHQPWILTPHPGEAARLLHTTTQAIQQDRFAAIRQLHRRYGGVIVLKGAGTLVMGDQPPLSLCGDGNPGMASGGMGDVLSGIIAGLVAQHLPPQLAARMAVCLHGAAADLAASKRGEVGLLASDLFDELRLLLNGLEA